MGKQTQIGSSKRNECGVHRSVSKLEYVSMSTLSGLKIFPRCVAKNLAITVIRVHNIVNRLFISHTPSRVTTRVSARVCRKRRGDSSKSTTNVIEESKITSDCAYE